MVVALCVGATALLVAVCVDAARVLVGAAALTGGFVAVGLGVETTDVLMALGVGVADGVGALDGVGVRLGVGVWDAGAVVDEACVTLADAAAGTTVVGCCGMAAPPATNMASPTGIPIAALPRPTGMSGLTQEWPTTTCHSAVTPMNSPTARRTAPAPSAKPAMSATTTSAPSPIQNAGPNLRPFED